MVALQDDEGVQAPVVKAGPRWKWWRALAVLVLVFGSAGAWLARGSDGGSVRITPAKLSPWPFTVDSVVLRCHDGALTAAGGGVEYALNGTALADGYPSADAIIRPDPDGIDLKMSRADAIALGAQHCPER